MYRHTHLIRALWLVALCGASMALWAGEKGLEPETGETKLTPEAAAAVLAGLEKSFTEQPAVTATFASETDDDLMGKRVEKGVLLVKRPDMVLQRFEKDGKPHKAMALIGTQGKRYNPAHNKTVVKEFNKAPKLLALMRAGMTGDFATLQKYYDVTVFEKTADGKKAWRLVLVKSRGPLPYARIVAHIAEGAPYFSQLKYEFKKGKGNDRLDTYSDVKVPAEVPTEKDFNDPLFAKGETQPPEAVDDLNETDDAKASTEE